MVNNSEKRLQIVNETQPRKKIKYGGKKEEVT